MSVREACDAFMADVEAQRRSVASLKKYRVLLINRRSPEKREKHSPSLTEFCAETGVQFTSQLLLPELTRFRGQWKDGAIAGGKKAGAPTRVWPIPGGSWLVEGESRTKTKAAQSYQPTDHALHARRSPRVAFRLRAVYGLARSR